MFKTGSKFLYGLAAFGWLAAIAYAMATGEQELGMDSLLGPLTFGYKGYVGDHIGYTVLMSLAVTALASPCSPRCCATPIPKTLPRPLASSRCPRCPAPTTTNFWPIVAAFSAAAVVLGLAIGSAMFAVGMVGLTSPPSSGRCGPGPTGPPATPRSTAASAPASWPGRDPGGCRAGDRRHRARRVPDAAGTAEVRLYVLFGAVPAIVLVLGFFIVARPSCRRTWWRACCWWAVWPSWVAAWRLRHRRRAGAQVARRDHGKDKAQKAKRGWRPALVAGTLVIGVAD
jgi:hypothetical protein